MAKTVEAYVRAADPATVVRDAEFFNSPGNATERLTFVPGLYLAEINEVQRELSPVFGEAADQIMAVDRRLLNEMRVDTPITVASGICPFPMSYNSLLSPAGRPGTARWYNAETRKPILLPQDLRAAVDVIVANQPPLTVANLMKAGGLTKGPLVLMEEVRFYIDWMMEKLLANGAPGQSVSERVLESARGRLGGYVTQQYERNYRAFERLRRLALGVSELEPARRVADTWVYYRQARDEQIAKWRRDLRDGDGLDEAGLRVAAYYSEALPSAYKQLGLMHYNGQLVIAEGAANLVVPNNGTAFNTARRVAFRDTVGRPEAPRVVAYASPSAQVALRKGQLEAEPVTAGPSSWEPDMERYMRSRSEWWSAVGQVVMWSFATPGTPTIRDLQQQVQGGSRRVNADIELLGEMRRVTAEVLDERR
ncbi:MAG TPA: hypothetical protein VLE99_04455 [Candidatus Saccharimonadales bacterium]|nr:hypothetical protein [Candidatus Saccharimonadales bacterium]